MPQPVRLDFTPPDEPDVTKLHIEESANGTSGWSELTGSPITNIGTYPDYISYVTISATSNIYWFRIRWENSGGVLSPYSQPVQGGTTSVVQKVVTRVMQRDPTSDERIVTQEAEWVVSRVMKTANPYDPLLDPTYDQLEGMTLLALARTMVHSLVVTSQQSASYTAGLVSEKAASGSTTATTAIDYLLNEANKVLGLNLTMIMLLEDIDPIGIGTVSGVDVDISRLLVTIE